MVNFETKTGFSQTKLLFEFPEPFDLMYNKTCPNVGSLKKRLKIKKKTIETAQAFWRKILN